MKKLRTIVATLLLLSIILGPITSINASAKVAPVKTSTTQVVPFAFDWVWLEEKTINNGEIGLWGGTNNQGFLIPKGARIMFQANANQYSYVDLIIYKKAADGQFYEFSSFTTTIPSGGATGLDPAPLTESGYFKFGIRSYNLSPATFSIVIGMDY